MKIDVQFVRSGASLPRYMSAGAAGADLRACLDESVDILPGEAKAVPTGISLSIPPGFAGFIFARSGLSLREGLAPANKVGVIDSDYRGEILVSLYNQSKEPRTILPGDRIAQIVFLEIPRASFLLKDVLEETDRGSGGFGSTGR